MDSPIKE